MLSLFFLFQFNIEKENVLISLDDLVSVKITKKNPEIQKFIFNKNSSTTGTSCIILDISVGGTNLYRQWGVRS